MSVRSSGSALPRSPAARCPISTSWGRRSSSSCAASLRPNTVRASPRQSCWSRWRKRARPSTAVSRRRSRPRLERKDHDAITRHGRTPSEHPSRSVRRPCRLPIRRSRFEKIRINPKGASMSTITTKDGAKLFYKDWGSGQTIVFSHGWPLSSDAWDIQMLFFGQQGCRVVAHDRRSHGRSDQTWDGNHMDQYADDLAELITKLDLENIVMIGHSTGGGEVAHYIGRHGTSRVARVVLVGAVPPLMLKTTGNPGGTPLEVFDGIRKGTGGDRSQRPLQFCLKAH